jgi:hypothetical protein
MGGEGRVQILQEGVHSAAQVGGEVEQLGGEEGPVLGELPRSEVQVTSQLPLIEPLERLKGMSQIMFGYVLYGEYEALPRLLRVVVPICKRFLLARVAIHFIYILSRV